MLGQVNWVSPEWKSIALSEALKVGKGYEQSSAGVGRGLQQNVKPQTLIDTLKLQEHWGLAVVENNFQKPSEETKNEKSFDSKEQLKEMDFWEENW